MCTSSPGLNGKFESKAVLSLAFPDVGTHQKNYPNFKCCAEMSNLLEAQCSIKVTFHSKLLIIMRLTLIPCFGFSTDSQSLSGLNKRLIGDFNALHYFSEHI